MIRRLIHGMLELEKARSLALAGGLRPRIWRLLCELPEVSKALGPALVGWLRTIMSIKGAAFAGGVLVVAQVTILTLNIMTPQVPILGLRVEGQLVGNTQKHKAERMFAQTVGQRDNRAIHVKIATYQGTIIPRQLGARGNWQQQYQHILKPGRSGNWVKRLVVQDRAAVGLYAVSLERTQLNDSLAAAYLDSISKVMSTAPANAYFALQHDQVVVVPEKAGISVDRKQAAALLSAAASDASPEAVSLELPTTQQPPAVSGGQLEKLMPQAQAIAAKPLTITASQQQVTLSREQLVGVMGVRLKTDPATHTPSVDIGFDEAKLNAQVDGLLMRAQIAPLPAVVDKGRVYRAGTSGLQGEDDHPVVHVLAALVQRETGVANPDAVALPMRKVDPPVVPLAALPPAERAAVAHSAPAAPAAPAAQNAGAVYLTLDDAPGQYTNDILDILKRYGVHATFYVIGRNAQRYPDQLKRISAEGHTVGNHSYSHTDLSKLPAANVQNELQTAQTAIQQITGSGPLIFRPPYGAQNTRVQTIATNMGLTTNLWSVDPQDWAQPGVKAITDRVVGKASAGSVILLHVLHRQTVDALPGIVEGLRNRGFTVQ